MKKLLSIVPILISLLLYFLLIFTQQVFADKYNPEYAYKPIPKELSKQYKAEMEQIIKEEYPKIIDKLNSDFNNGKKYYKTLMKYGDNDYFNNLVNDVVYNEMPYIDIDLYVKLVKITQQKYLGLNFDSLPTDCENPFEEYLKPYFKDNNINSFKLKNLKWIKKRKFKIIDNYRKIYAEKEIQKNDKIAINRENYVPIPKELSKQYKFEMEQILTDEYKRNVKEIDEAFAEGKKLYEKIMTKGFDQETFNSLDNITNVVFYHMEIDTYIKLAKVTQEKYLGSKFELYEDEWLTPYYEFFLPYFKDNDVNMKFLDKLADYDFIHYKKLRNYMKYIKVFFDLPASDYD